MIKLKIYNPERKLQRQFNTFFQNYPLDRLETVAEQVGLHHLYIVEEADGGLYFPDLFKHMVVAIWKKLSRRSGMGRKKGVFEAAMIIAFEFLKQHRYVNRGSVMRNVRLTNKGSRRNIYHADGQCSRSRGEAESKSNMFDRLFMQYFRNSEPRSTKTIGQPSGVART